MAEILISPGVLTNEIDRSFIPSAPITVGAAIIGPTVKGPVEIPTVVTSWAEYQALFGTTFNSGSANNQQKYSYFTSIAAYNYFINGGESLLVARVASGTFSSATSSLISTAASGTFTQSPFVLQTLSKGIIMNNTGAELTDNVLTSGSVDNIRWQILNSNSGSGKFDLLIRQGNDSVKSPVILESYTNLTLDPNSPNYISKVIGDTVANYNSTENYIEYSGSYPNKSKYVTVKQVNYTTPNFFNSNGKISNANYTGSIPVNASGTFGSATGTLLTGKGYYYNNIDSTDIQGLVGANYDNMISLLRNQDDYKFNILLTPGLYSNATYTSQINNIISNVEERGDSIYVLDLAKYGETIVNVTSEAGDYDTSYAASYWPWVQVKEPTIGNDVWVPASTVIGGVYAYTDNSSEPWFAPAGINRGLLAVTQAERKLSQTNRDDLYEAKVNPIATFPGTGVIVYGQKTLQTRASALDRVNVRRLLITLKSYISQVALNLVFEQNTIATRNSFLAQINPYLASVQQRQGLYAFKVVMDESNNTPDVIDRNELIGNIYLQPTKTAEFIYLNFNITPTGATFPV